jgi:hypothetical protein
LSFWHWHNLKAACIISYDRDDNGKLLSDGLLAVYKKKILLSVDGAEQKANQKPNQI